MPYTPPDPNALLYARVRFALTGDQNVGPEDPALAFLVQDVLDDIFAGEPRIQTDADGNLTGAIALTGADLRAVQAWVGSEAAARFVESPAGRGLEMMQTQIKIGRVTKTYEFFGPDAVICHFREEAARARLRISFIRARAVARNQNSDKGSSGFGLPGHRRQIGQPRTVQGQALGLGREDLL